jgi:uncharacterized spore protein YtfJ
MVTDLRAIFGEITDRLHGTATVRTVFGDPVQAGGKTIVPVAKVGYGFGAGADNDKDKSSSGGGGGIGVKPMGVLVVTDERTRFIGFGQKPRLLAMLGLGFLLGLAFGRFQQKRRPEEQGM